MGHRVQRGLEVEKIEGLYWLDANAQKLICDDNINWCNSSINH